MKNSDKQNQKIAYIQGGGEMGELTRKYPWRNTAIGSMEDWPLSLRTLVNMMLASRFPMLIFWGADLLTFYNDAFRPSLGNNGKHPSSLGQRGEESWAESWPVIGPMIYNIMAGGEAVWFEDQKLPLYREGQMSYAYWTYSFSPINGDAGQVNGVLVTCSETTKAVETLQHLAKSESRFQNMVRDITTGIIVLVGTEMKVEIVNDAYARIVGYRADDLLGKPLFSIIPEAEAVFRPVLNKVLSEQQAISLNNISYTVTDEDGQLKEGYLNLVYQPYREADNHVCGVMVLCQDVTGQVKARQKVEKSQQELLSSFEEAPVAIATISEENLTFRIVNPFYAELVGRTPQQLINKPMLEALPELAGQGFDDLLRGVIATGFPYMAKEVPAKIERAGRLETIYVDLSYQPRKEGISDRINGVLVVATDVTQQVRSRREVEAAKQTIEYAVEVSDLGYFNIDLATGVAICSAKIIEWFGLAGEVTTAAEVISHIYPEDREKANAIFQASLNGNDGGKHDVTYRLISKKTGDLMYLRSIGQVQYKDGKGIFATGIIQNITEQFAYNQNLADSEARFRSLIEEAPIATCLFTGSEMTITVANDAMIQTWGKGPSVIGMPLLEALPELKGQYFLPLLKELYTTGNTYEVKGGQVDLVIEGKLKTFYFDYVFKPLRDADNNIYAIMEMAIDVTEQVLTRAKIGKAEEDLRMAVDAAELGVFSANLAERKFEASVRMKEFFGFAPVEEPSYQAVVSRVQEDYRHSIVGQITNAIQNGTRFDAELPVVVDADNSVRWVRTIGTVQQDSAGKRFFSGIANDITEKKLDEIRKNDFISMVSHELKTPLTSLSGYLEFVAMEAAKKEDVFTSGLLQKATKQVGKMTTMINGFLNISRLESGKLQINKTQFDMAGLIKETEEEIRASINTHRVVFTDTAPIFVLADRDKIGQVISNLVNNAIKYSPANTTIQVACTMQNGIAQISVQDEGIGISREDQPRLFERYYRVGSNNSIAGFGIGLYLCKEIIDRHQGRIWLESEPGSGSTFYFTLPVVQ